MQSVERALDLAVFIIQNGGSTPLADRTFHQVLKGYRQEGCAALWRLDCVAVAGTGENHSLNSLRPVGAIGVNLVRVSEATVLGERVARGEVNDTTLVSEIERIRKLPAPYTRWVAAAGAAGAGAFFSLITGGDWGSFAIAIVAAGAGQFIRSILQQNQCTVLTVTFVCAVISAFIGAAGLRLGISQMLPATLIASVIYIVPGLPLINGFYDVVTHRFLIIGLERIANAMFLFLVLTIAIALALTVML